MGWVCSGALASAAILVLTAVAGVAWHTAQYIIRRRVPDVQTSPADYGLAFEAVEFPARDGLILRGWFIPASDARSAVIFCHGHAGSMDPDVQYAPWFHAAGLSVLMFDFRAHGRSDGERVSMGYSERQDLLGAVDWLQARGVERIGVLGFSMGGVVAMITASHSDAIVAVVSDGGFARLTTAIAAGMRERGLPGFLAQPLAQLAVWLAGARLGVRLPEADPIRWVAGIAPRALLLVHGGADPYTSDSEIQELLARAGEPKELWIVPEAGHREVDQHRPEEYRERVVGFFERHLLGIEEEGR